MVPPKNIKPQPIGILTGPTATGKTGLAIEWALALKSLNVEIINADSLLVYREMNIGTAKPTLDELRQVPHHLIDIVEPNQRFTSGEFIRSAQKAIDEIENRSNRALIVGATGFYLKSLLFGMWSAPPSDPDLRKKLEIINNQDLYQRLLLVDPKSALRIGPADRYRLVRSLEIFELSGKIPSELEQDQAREANPRFHLWIIDRPQSELNERIRLRTEKMISDGIVDEYQKIQTRYPDSHALQAVGYRQVGLYLKNKSPSGRKIASGLKGLSDEIQLATRQLVKQQRTWFRNQTARVPGSKWYLLDAERTQLEKDFKATYG